MQQVCFLKLISYFPTVPVQRNVNYPTIYLLLTSNILVRLCIFYFNLSVIKIINWFKYRYPKWKCARGPDCIYFLMISRAGTFLRHPLSPAHTTTEARIPFTTPYIRRLAALTTSSGWRFFKPNFIQRGGTFLTRGIRK